MSASESGLSEIVAHSAEADPVEALRNTLSDILSGLVSVGGGPTICEG